MVLLRNAEADEHSPGGPDDGFTPRHSAAGLRWLFDRYQLWGLSMSQLGELLGGVSEDCLRDWERHVKANAEINIPHDTVERISLLLGIHKGLASITPDGQENDAYNMFTQSLNLMGLKECSIRDFLLEEGSIEAMYYVRRSVDGMRA